MENTMYHRRSNWAARPCYVEGFYSLYRRDQWGYSLGLIPKEIVDNSDDWEVQTPNKKVDFFHLLNPNP